MNRFLLVLLSLGMVAPALAQSDVAQTYRMTPKAGHGAMAEAALAEHAEWRNANNDPWTWDLFEVINGEDLGDFIARSGNHTWADFDAYNFEGAGAHFNEVVMPHLESITSMFTIGDTTNVNWPTSPDGANIISIADYDLHIGKMDDFREVIGKYHEALQEAGHPVHYYFATVANGGRGEDIIGVFPSPNFAGLAADDPSVESVMAKHYSEVGFEALGEKFQSAIKDVRSWMVVSRPDLSVNQGQ